MEPNNITSIRLEISALVSECRALAERADMALLAGHEPRGTVKALNHKQARKATLAIRLQAMLDHYHELCAERDRLDDLGAPTAHLTQTINRIWGA